MFHYSPATLCALLAKHNLAIESARFRSEFASITCSLRVLCNRVRSGPVQTDRSGVLNPERLAQEVAQLMVNTLDRVHLGDAIEVMAIKPPVVTA